MFENTRNIPYQGFDFKDYLIFYYQICSEATHLLIQEEDLEFLSTLIS